ncbi:MAG: alpha-L-fucosidase [Kiritimatiellae bacterium]|nr:alpha-L-fucosidase [Kiritimatiellia bacterium]
MNVAKTALFFAAAAALHPFVRAEYAPEEWNLEARRQFADQRFGIFIHWGLYSNFAQGEWYLRSGDADNGWKPLDREAYERMMHGFCPSKFDADEWARTFKKSGAKYVTITSRHHDGFSLWHTRADDGYNVANTPFKRDVLAEIRKACDREGLQLNFYYSLMDWHRKDYPAGVVASSVLGGQKGDYASYKKFMLAQIDELITRYRPGNIWFDGEWEHARHQDDGTWKRTLDWQLDDIYDFIHARKTLVANNNHQPIRAKEDIQLFERDLPGDNGDAGFSRHQPVVNDRPVEQCDVIQRGVWGYRIGERDFRTPEDVVAMVARAAAKGSNLLMNVGPDGSGQLPRRAVEVLEKVGVWFGKNGESIYGTDAGGISSGKAVVSTRKGGVLYLHFLDPKTDAIEFATDADFAEASVLGTGAAVPIAKTAAGKVRIVAPRAAGDGFDVVVKLSPAR